MGKLPLTDEFKELAKSLVLALFAVACVLALLANKAAPFVLAAAACLKLFCPAWPFGWAETLAFPIFAWAATLPVITLFYFLIEAYAED